MAILAAPTFRSPVRWALAACAALVLAACASSPPAPVIDLSSGAPRSGETQTPTHEPATGVYRVARGDTLYAIAFRHGLDYRDIAAWNGIEPPYRIYPGEEVKLSGPAHARLAAAAIPPPGRERNVAPAATSGVAPASAHAAPPEATQPGMFEEVPATKPVAAAPETTAAAPATAPAVQESAAVARPPPAAVAPAANPPGEHPTPSRNGSEPATASASAVPDGSVTTAGGVTWRWPGRGALVGTFAAGDPTRQGIDIAGNAGDPVVAAADGEVVYSGNGLLGYGELIIVKHNASYLSAYGHNRKRLVQEGEHVRGGQRIAEMGSSASSRDELHFEIRKNGKPVNPLDYLPAR